MEKKTDQELMEAGRRFDEHLRKNPEEFQDLEIRISMQVGDTIHKGILDQAQAAPRFKAEVFH